MSSATNTRLPTLRGFMNVGDLTAGVKTLGCIRIRGVLKAAVCRPAQQKQVAAGALKRSGMSSFKRYVRLACGGYNVNMDS